MVRHRFGLARALLSVKARGRTASYLSVPGCSHGCARLIYPFVSCDYGCTGLKGQAQNPGSAYLSFKTGTENSPPVCERRGRFSLTIAS